MIDLDSMVKALRLAWLKRIFSTNVLKYMEDLFHAFIKRRWRISNFSVQLHNERSFNNINILQRTFTMHGGQNSGHNSGISFLTRKTGYRQLGIKKILG